MWDPARYRDTDYGLRAGENFEPADDALEADAMTTAPHVMTVLGPVDPVEIGITMPYTHLLAHLRASSDTDTDLVRDSLQQANMALEAWVLSGGRTVVDATANDQGRDIDGLVSLARRSPVHIIGATGPTVSEAQIPEPAMLVERIVADLVDGVGQSDARCGVIVVKCRAARLTEQEKTAVQVAAVAAARTRAPVIMRVPDLYAATAGLRCYEAAGGRIGNVILTGFCQSLAEADQLERSGPECWWCFESFGRFADRAKEHIAETVAYLVNHGYGSRLLVSADPRRNPWSQEVDGAYGFADFLDHVPLALMAAGVSADEVKSLLIDNPAQALTIRPYTQ